VGFRNFGTVFKISPAGALSTLHSFTGGSDGPINEATTVKLVSFERPQPLNWRGFCHLTTLHQFYGYGMSAYLRARWIPGFRQPTDIPIPYFRLQTLMTLLGQRSATCLLVVSV
jgi:hypothetical protein